MYDLISYVISCCDCCFFSASEMTCIVSGGALNSTHSLTAVIEAAIWVKSMYNDKIVMKRKKKRENMEIEEIYT